MPIEDRIIDNRQKNVALTYWTCPTAQLLTFTQTTESTGETRGTHKNKKH